MEEGQDVSILYKHFVISRQPCEDIQCSRYDLSSKREVKLGSHVLQEYLLKCFKINQLCTNDNKTGPFH